MSKYKRNLKFKGTVFMFSLVHLMSVLEIYVSDVSLV